MEEIRVTIVWMKLKRIAQLESRSFEDPTVHVTDPLTGARPPYSVFLSTITTYSDFNCVLLIYLYKAFFYLSLLTDFRIPSQKALEVNPAKYTQMPRRHHSTQKE